MGCHNLATAAENDTEDQESSLLNRRGRKPAAYGLGTEGLPPEEKVQSKKK